MSGETEKFVTLVASLKGHEQVRSRVRKDVIQSESAFLKEYIEDGAVEIKIPLKRPENLNLILEYLYEGMLTTSNEVHLESLWNDAKILGLVNLEKVCVDRLTDTVSLNSWIQKLEFSQAEGCHELESNVLGFLDDNFKDCCSSSKFALLSIDQMVQVLQLPTVKTNITESNRIGLILDWIKANEIYRCSEGHRLLEQVDLMNLNESSLHRIFDEESALRDWRSVAIFERAIRLKRIKEEARPSGTVDGQPDENELIQADPHAVQKLQDRQMINIKQEVVSEDSAFRFSFKQDTSSPSSSSSSSSSIYEAMDTVESNDDDSSSPPPKIPRLGYSQMEVEPSARNQRATGTQKQILYLRQRSNGLTSLSFVTIGADYISQPQQARGSLPKYIHGVPKLIWDQEAQTLFFLGEFVENGCKFPSVNYMHGNGTPQLTALPKMIHRRHQYQPLFLKGSVYVFGGSQSLSYSNNNRFSKAEVLDTTAPTAEWEWQSIASLSPKRDLYAATYLDGKIYLTGGAVDDHPRNTPLITKHILCYDLGENRWRRLKKKKRRRDMKNFRCGHAAIAHSRKIYAFGGSGRKYDDPSEHLENMKSAEFYEIQKKSSKLIAPMCRPRYGGSAVEIDGKFYVIGGDQSNEGEGHSSVECYDPEKNSWTLVSESVDDKGFFDSIAVIHDPEYFFKGK